MPSGLGIEPLKTRKFHSKQSQYEHMPEVPFRWLFLGPGSPGKTLTLHNLMLSHYRGVFHYVAIWSPTAKLDGGCKPVFKYLEEEVGQKMDDPKNPNVFEAFGKIETEFSMTSLR